MAEPPSSTGAASTQPTDATTGTSTFFFLPPSTGEPASSSAREAVRVHLARQTHAAWRRQGIRNRESGVPASLLHVSDIVVRPQSCTPGRSPTRTTLPASVQTDRPVLEASGSTESEDPASRAVQHTPTIHPLQELPLTPWPLERTPFVDDVMHKFLFSYAPAVYKRIGFRGKGPDTAFLRHLCPRLIQDEMLASVIVAHTSAMQGIDLIENTPQAMEATRYLNRAIVILRERVAEGNMSDEVVLTIWLAITTCNFLHDNSQAALHLRGLKAAVGARRSPRAPEHHCADCPLEFSPLPMEHIEAHSLPPGFLELHLLGDLSDTLVQLLGSLRTALDSRTFPLQHCYCSYLVRLLLNLRGFHLGSIAGQLVEVSLLAFLKWASQAGCECHKLADGYLQSRCYRLLGTDFTSCAPELVEWTSSMLIATLGPGTISSDLASHLQTNLGFSEAREKSFTEHFFWTPELSERLSNFEIDVPDETRELPELPSVQDALAELVESYTNDQCLAARSLIIDGLAMGHV